MENLIVLQKFFHSYPFSIEVLLKHSITRDAYYALLTCLDTSFSESVKDKIYPVLRLGHATSKGFPEQTMLLDLLHPRVDHVGGYLPLNTLAIEEKQSMKQVFGEVGFSVSFSSGVLKELLMVTFKQN